MSDADATSRLAETAYNSIRGMKCPGASEHKRTSTFHRFYRSVQQNGRVPFETRPLKSKSLLG
jgi:hypothetical protein